MGKSDDMTGGFLVLFVFGIAIIWWLVCFANAEEKR